MGRYHQNPDVDLQLKMNGYRPKRPLPMRLPAPIDLPLPPPRVPPQASTLDRVGEAFMWALLVGLGCTALWKALAALLDVL